jgi:GntR family transcriptional regulator
MAEPLYQRIAEDMRGRIESGELPPGSQLPTELELREAYGASRSTIRDALRRLNSLGMVVTKPGLGTFVLPEQLEPFVTTLSAYGEPGRSGGEGATYLSQVSAEHRQAGVSVPRVEARQAPDDVASRLRAVPGSMVVTRHQERFIDETPWSLQTSFYPFEFAASGAQRLLIAEDIAGGTVKYLEVTLGIRQVGYRDWISAREPDATEQAFFEISPDATVFEHFRTGYDQNGKPMRVTVTVYPADRNQFTFEVGTLP